MPRGVRVERVQHTKRPVGVELQVVVEGIDRAEDEGGGGAHVVTDVAEAASHIVLCEVVRQR